MKYPKKEIAVVGLTYSGFAKIATIKQGGNGSLYYTSKISGIPTHHSYHSNGTIKMTTQGGDFPSYKLKPVQEVEFVQSSFIALSLTNLSDVLEISQVAKEKDGFILIDLRGFTSLGISIHYCAPDKLKAIQESLIFLQKVGSITEIHISTITNPYIVLIIQKDVKKDIRES